jgi:NADH-quinone oxidoreductase subunit G
LQIADVEHLTGLLVIGSDLRREVPMLAHRIRKAAVRGGARVSFLNPRRFDYLFPVAAYCLAEQDIVADLAAVVHAAAAASGSGVAAHVPAAMVGETHRALAAALMTGERRAVMLGTLAQRHPRYAELKSLAATLATLAGASLGLITEGANAAGAYLAGAVPHRLPGGLTVPVAGAAPGFSARTMLETWLKAYVLLGGIDPAADLAPNADGLGAADLCIAVTTHLPDSLRAMAHVVLPVGCFAETSGSYVNLEGRWQSWPGAARLPGESRPAWKVLRVLGNALGLPGFEYASSDEVLAELKSACGPTTPPPGHGGLAALAAPVEGVASDLPWVLLPAYQGDVLVRGSDALAKTADGQAVRTVI